MIKVKPEQIINGVIRFQKAGSLVAVIVGVVGVSATHVYPSAVGLFRSNSLTNAGAFVCWCSVHAVSTPPSASPLTSSVPSGACTQAPSCTSQRLLRVMPKNSAWLTTTSPRDKPPLHPWPSPNPVLEFDLEHLSATSRENCHVWSEPPSCNL